MTARRAGERGTRTHLLAVVVGGLSLALMPTTTAARNDTSPAAYAVVAVQAAIDVNNRAYVAALVKKNATAFGDLFTIDAVSMPSTAATIHGRDAIVASITSVFARMTFVRGTLRTLETHLEGTSASEIGTYSFDVIVDGNARTLEGRYLVIWREVGGAWKIAVESSQPGAPPI